MNDGFRVAEVSGRFMAEFYERGDDGAVTYRSASFRNEAEAWTWVKERQRDAAVEEVGPTFPVYVSIPTETGTYRVTIAGRGLDEAESLGEFSNSEHAQTFTRRMETLDRGKTTRASDLPAP